MDPSKVNPKDCLDIMLTDVQLHTQKIRKPNPLGRQIAKVINAKGKSGRAYSSNIQFDANGGILSIDIETEKYLHKLAEKKGKKYIRIFAPKDGLPINLGKDTVERISALEKKGIAKIFKRVYSKDG